MMALSLDYCNNYYHHIWLTIIQAVKRHALLVLISEFIVSGLFIAKQNKYYNYNNLQATLHQLNNIPNITTSQVYILSPCMS